MNPRSAFEEWLKIHCDRHGLTQKYLAEAVDCAVSLTAQLEQGR